MLGYKVTLTSFRIFRHIMFPMLQKHFFSLEKKTHKLHLVFINYLANNFNKLFYFIEDLDANLTSYFIYRNNLLNWNLNSLQNHLLKVVN